MHPPNSFSLAKTQSHHVDIPDPKPLRWPPRPAGFGAAFVDLNARIERRSSPFSPAYQFNLRQFRFFEIDRIARYRASRGIAIDSNAFGRAVASCAEPNVAARWIKRFCPDLDPADIGALVEVSGRACARFSATQLGDLVGLTVEERDNLAIKTFRPAGVSPGDFKAHAKNRKRKNDNLRAEGKRREAGIPPRAKSDQAAARAKALGISRSTYYAKRKAGLIYEETEPDAKCATGYRVFANLASGAKFAAPPDWRAPPWIMAAFARPARIVPANHNADTAHIGALVAAHAAAHRLAASTRRRSKPSPINTRAEGAAA